MRRAMVEWCAIFLGATASVIPYGASSKTIVKELRGKVPGTLNKRTGLWVGTAGAMAGRFMTMAEAEQADRDGAAVGLLGEQFPFGDIDIEDAILANEILQLMLVMLGPAPVRRREGSTRCGAMYTGVNIRKRGLKWGGDKEKGIKDNGVEVLGRGQYWNADGLHPSGKPYYWNEPHPCDLGPFNLTVITQDMVDAFMAAVRELLASRGIEVTVLGGRREGLSTGVRTGLDNPSLHAPSPEAVLDLLASYRPAELHHDDFVQHIVAIKAALGPDREDYYPNVLEWAPGVRSTEDEATRKRWDSIHDASLGWDWLCRKAGYVGDAFADPPPADMMPPDPGKTMLANLQANWVYVLNGACFYNTKDKGFITKDGFNAEFIKLAPYGMGGRRSAVAHMLNDPGTQKARTLTYRPQHIEEREPEKFLILQEPPGSGVTAFNTWMPPNITPIRGVEPSGAWFNHIHRGMPIEAERNHFFDWWAFIFQHPGIKINHALVLVSSIHGTGKDLVYLPFFRGVGMPQNVWTLRPDNIAARFSSHLMSQIIYVSEMTDFSEKKSDYNKMKMLMASPPEYIPMELKNKDQCMIPNIQNWVFASNHENAISLEPADRRFWVQLFAVGLEDGDYFMRIGEDIDRQTQHIVGFVMDRKISHFNPHAPPPMTEPKAEMIMLARSPVARWLDAQFDVGGQWEKKVFMTASHVLEVAEGFSVPENVSRGIHKGHIETAFRQHGFTLIEGKHYIAGKVTRVWTRDKHFKTASGKLLAAQVEADWKKR